MTAVRQALPLAQWQSGRQAQFLPLMLIVQIFLSVTTVLGHGLLVGNPPSELALDLATGAPTITLISVGLIMTPQIVAQSRTEGSLDWMRTLPVPRPAFLVGDPIVWSLLALPRMVLGVVIVLLFTPVSYPASRLPTWLATAHEYFPVAPMAQLIRAGLAQNQFTMPGRSLVVLLAWCVAWRPGADARTWHGEAWTSCATSRSSSSRHLSR